MNSSDQEALDIHAELLEISNKNESHSRFIKPMTTAAAAAMGSNFKSEGKKREGAQKFLEETPENGQFNQYWYSLHTIEAMRQCINQVFESRSKTTESRQVAFLSTPSIYFALPEEERVHCTLFDLDETLSNDPSFVRYDFEQPLDFPSALQHSFDMVVIDPPFITREVWENYAQTTKALLRNPPCPYPDASDQSDRGIVLATTVRENQFLMKELFDAQPMEFRPSIPNLVYQYNIFLNVESPVLSEVNQEIDSSF